MKQQITFLAFLILLCTACNNGQKDLITGEWSAISLTEEGDSLAIDPSVIGFTFDIEKDVYTYRSTLGYQEAGTFFIQSKYLVTQDTTKKEADEKSVEILQLLEDTLSLRMMDAKKERILTLVKK